LQKDKSVKLVDVRSREEFDAVLQAVVKSRRMVSFFPPTRRFQAGAKISNHFAVISSSKRLLSW
jgi:hypothetical protein